MKTVLLIEDDQTTGAAFVALAKDLGIDVVWETHSGSAIQAYKKWKTELWAIVFDGFLEKTSGDDTLHIIRLVVADGFKGHMIAASTSDSMRELMISVGCTLDCSSKMHTLAELETLLQNEQEK